MEKVNSLSRYSPKSAIKYLTELVKDGLSSVLLFPVLDGSERSIESAFSVSTNPILKLIPQLKEAFPSLLIMADICLCGFSETGHCCVFDENREMDNLKSIEILSHLALTYAQVGVDVVAPSDMMDGRVGAIRRKLNSNGHSKVPILSYSAKFASCFYGPFRDAAGSGPKFGDRRCYQLPPGSTGLAMRAVVRDLEEGADMIMVKPGLPYLDLVSKIHEKHSTIPLAVYHVSGECALLHHGSRAGAIDLKTAVMEVMTSFKRAGASIIITYFTPQLLKWIKD